MHQSNLAKMYCEKILMNMQYKISELRGEDFGISSGFFYLRLKNF